MTITNARPSVTIRCARCAGRGAALALLLLLAACGGGSDSHPLMWQSSPHVGVLQDQAGTDPDPVTYRVDAEAGPGGIINPPSTTAVAGATALFAIVADPGYRIEAVSGCGGERFGGSRYRTAPVNAGCTVTATFAIESYRVETLVRSNIGGSTDGDGVFEFGEEATVVATPDAGYRFVAWTEAGRVVSEEPEFTFAVTRNRAFSATFDIAENVSQVAMPPAGVVRVVEARHAPAGVVFASTAELDPGDGGAGVWRSEDGGASWTRTSERTATFISIASGDPDLVFAGTSNGYLVSTDGGRTWAEGVLEGPVGQPIPINDASMIDADGGIFAAVSNLGDPGLHRSPDAGATWDAVFTPADAGGFQGAQLRRVEVSPGEPATVHATTLTDADLWRSVDGGASFFSIRDGIAEDEPDVLAAGVRADPDDPQRLFVERHISLNGGADWTVAEDVSPRNTLWYEGRLLRVADAELLVSDDAGATWSVVLELVGRTGDFDPGRVMLAEDALYIQLEDALNLVHRIDLDLIQAAFDAL